MEASDAPVILAYDGSDPAKAAVRAAARLLTAKKVVVVTVWEPGLALISSAASIPPGAEIPGPDLETITEVDQKAQDHASSVAEQGAELARSAGLEAEAQAVPDEVNVGETVVRIAKERGAQAVVIGSRSLSGLRATFLGSTSQTVAHHAHVPVLVVREGEQGGA